MCIQLTLINPQVISHGIKLRLILKHWTDWFEQLTGQGVKLNLLWLYFYNLSLRVLIWKWGLVNGHGAVFLTFELFRVLFIRLHHLHCTLLRSNTLIESTIVALLVNSRSRSQIVRVFGLEGVLPLERLIVQVKICLLDLLQATIHDVLVALHLFESLLDWLTIHLAMFFAWVGTGLF